MFWSLERPVTNNANELNIDKQAFDEMKKVGNMIDQMIECLIELRVRNNDNKISNGGG